MINELAKQVHENAKEKGFFDKEKNIAEMLCLIHSEVSEALEADRTDNYSALEASQMNVLMGWNDDVDFKNNYQTLVKGSFEEEMADIVIRVMDMCAFKGIDLERHIRAKMRFNSLRVKMHGKKY